jgi:FemAB-related protein (PEP-CTERM system-associated)
MAMNSLLEPQVSFLNHALNTQTKPNSLNVKVLKESDYPAWDHFVSDHPDASVYHLSVWRHVLECAFGKSWYLVGAREGVKVVAGVPLVHMHSSLFGNSLVSMPFFNYGGMLVQEEHMLAPVLEACIHLAKELEAQHIELRHLQNYYPQLPVKTEKVSMWLTLPNDAEALMKSFKPKLRSQVRKGNKNKLKVRSGGIELLDDFYEVFSRNMRALGTPVYGKQFFQYILEAFPKGAHLVIVTSPESLPIAGAFLLGFRDRVEIPWASSLREYNYLQSNMFLYWNCLKYACEQGYRTFDFGRSTVGQPTYKFKEQWGAQPVAHHWHYWLKGDRELPQFNPQNPKFRLAIATWQRLPLSLTRLLGPAIAKHLP